MFLRPRVRPFRPARERRLAAAFACAAFLVLSPAAYPKDEYHSYAVTAWRVPEGLPSDRVRSLLLDRQGYLWIATFNGLARFDGVRFRHYHVANAPGLKNNLLQSLFQDRAGRIWIGHDTGDITVWHDNHFHPIATEAGWSGAPADEFVEDHQGTVWVRNRPGWLLPVRDLAAGAVVRDVTSTRLLELVTDSDGEVWIACSDTVYRLDTSDPAAPRIAEKVPYSGSGRAQIGRATAGGIWIAAGASFRRWQRGEWTGDTRENPVRSRYALNPWFETPDGRLVIGTFDDGLHVVPPKGAAKRIGAAEGVPAGFVTAVLEDRAGNLWAAVGDQGVCRIRPSLVTMIKPPHDWGDRAVNVVAEDRHGNLWAGTEGGGLFRYAQGAWSNFASWPTNPVVTALRRDRDGNLWAGFADGLVGQVTDDRLQRVLHHRDLSNASAVLDASDGRLWVGGLAGAGYLEQGRFHLVESSAGALSHVRAFAETADRAIWIATLGGGVGRYHAGKLTMYDRAAGLPSDYVWSLCAARDGTLWIGTYDRGLTCFRDGRFHVLPFAAGLPANMIGQIVEDDARNLWLATNGGIVRIAGTEVERFLAGKVDVIATTTLDASDGLSTLGLSGGMQCSAIQAADGALWFATNRGLARVDPKQTRPSPPPPSVVIEAVRIDGVDTVPERREGGAVLVVPPGSRRIEIDYTGLSLDAPQRLQFRYRLTEADAAWTDAGGRRTAYVSYLRPGSYEFHVEARQESGASSAARLAVEVTPYLWETTWFRFAAVVAALLGFSGAVALVLRLRHRRRIARIEQARALEQDRTRIAHDLHDKIGAGLTELSFLSHSALNAQTDPAKVAERLREIQGTTSEMTEAIDEIVWAINPRHDSLESLVSYVGRTVQEFAQNTGLQCLIDVPIDQEHIPVTAEMRHELYLTLREALHNVVKHAAATEVRFAARRTGAELSFLLEDNGRGLSGHRREDGSPESRGLGFETMRQRISRLGGSIDWTAREEGGTRIRIRLPVRTDSPVSPELVT